MEKLEWLKQFIADPFRKSIANLIYDMRKVGASYGAIKMTIDELVPVYLVGITEDSSPVFIDSYYDLCMRLESVGITYGELSSHERQHCDRDLTYIQNEGMFSLVDRREDVKAAVLEQLSNASIAILGSITVANHGQKGATFSTPDLSVNVDESEAGKLCAALENGETFVLYNEEKASLVAVLPNSLAITSTHSISETAKSELTRVLNLFQIN